MEQLIIPNNRKQSNKFFPKGYERRNRFKKEDKLSDSKSNFNELKFKSKVNEFRLNLTLQQVFAIIAVVVKLIASHCTEEEPKQMITDVARALASCGVV